MICVASVRVGPARQAFWAVWDRAAGRLHEQTVTGRGPLWLWAGGASLRHGALQVELALDETAGIETVCAAGEAYAWTRKQGGVRASGTVSIDGRTLPIDGHAVIDDTAAYYPRHTSWRWSAGVGTAAGRPPGRLEPRQRRQRPADEQRTHDLDRRRTDRGAPVHLRRRPRARRRPALPSRSGARAHKQNLLVVRSEYRQPFGTFSGTPSGRDRP